MGYGLWVMGYGLWVTGYGVWVTGFFAEERFQILYFVNGLVGFYLAVVENDDAVTHGVDLLHDVGRENDRTLFAKVANEGSDLDELVGVEAGGGFIEDEQLGIAEERLGEADTLAVAFAQFADMLVTLRRQADAVDEVINNIGIPRFRDTGKSRHKLQVLGDVHLVVEGVVLGEVADAFGYGNGTVVSAPEADEDLHQRGLTGTVGSEQSEDLAFGNGQRDVAQDLLRPKRLVDMLNMHHVCVLQFCGAKLLLFFDIHK